ncbi:MAG TPA: tetratricopeptide repeat protein [Dongiaceae bacterium]|nr:tetratricopeptide repeat protein [Dongiaceae bacterium]
MPDIPSAPGKLTEPPPNEPRLESWGEIAAYLRRDVRTVQRWERFHGLPVRRLVIGKLGQVYAYKSELDAWVRKRQPGFDDDSSGADTSLDNSAESKQPSPDKPPVISEGKPRIWWKIALLGILPLAALGWVNPVHDWFRALLFPSQKQLLFVRPFTSLSPEPEQQVFVKGLKDEMIIQLGRIDPERLGVFAPTTSDAEGNRSIAELRTGLLADYVLEGSVRRAVNQLRIDVVLISSKDGSQVWSKSYTGEAQNILQLQDDVTSDIATQIQGTLPRSNSVRNPFHAGHPVDPKAYDAYLEGRVHWLNRDLLRSRESYERALHIDPDYPRARAGLAMVYLLLGQSPNDILRPSESVPLAREAAQAALQKDPQTADAYCVLGNIAQSYDHDMALAERQFKQALKLDPSNVTAHEWYGYFLVVNNRIPEALEETKRALDLDPASPLLQNVQGEVYYYQRDFDGAIQQELRALERSPGFLYPRIWLASAYREKKMYPQALSEFEITRKQSNDSPALLGLYGHALAVSGDIPAARKILQDLQMISQQRYVPALYFAAIYTGLGDKPHAFEFLEKSFADQNDRLVYLGTDPIADSLRSDPRFQDLMKRCGLH